MSYRSLVKGIMQYNEAPVRYKTLAAVQQEPWSTGIRLFLRNRILIMGLFSDKSILNRIGDIDV